MCQSVHSHKVPAYIYSRARAGIGDRLCIITAGTLQKERYSRTLSTLFVAPYATRRRRRPAPINIDQAQQWPAGKRIDILYFPPTLTGCLRARCVTQTAIPGQTAGYAVLAAILRTTRC